MITVFLSTQRELSLLRANGVKVVAILFPHMLPSLRHGTLHLPCGVGYVQVLAPHPESRINDLRERAVKLLHD